MEIKTHVDGRVLTRDYEQLHYYPNQDSRADEFRTIAETAVEVFRLEPTQELFDKILDSVYVQEPTIQEKADVLEPLLDKLMVFFGNLIAEMKESELAKQHEENKRMEMWIATQVSQTNNIKGQEVKLDE